MKEKIVEILVHIMSELQARNTLGEIDLSDLKSRGYTQSEISAALSWLYEHMKVENGAVSIPAEPGGSKRILHEAEKAVFSTESQGYLIQLRELGLLDDRDLELVIDKAFLSGCEKLSVEEVREIVAVVLFSKSGNAHLAFLSSRETIH